MKLVGWLLDSPELFNPYWTQVLYSPEDGDFTFRQTRFDRETDHPYYFQERVEPWEIPSELAWRNAWFEWASVPLGLPGVGSAGVESFEEFVLLGLLGSREKAARGWNDFILGKRKSPPFPELRKPRKPRKKAVS